LPEGFLERTNKDRGMVVRTGAPLLAVLRKESVWGVHDSLWFELVEAVVAGVSMTWPVYAKQHLSMNDLVKDMKMAINLQREDDGFVRISRRKGLTS
jgi:hypothetical protein